VSPLSQVVGWPTRTSARLRCFAGLAAAIGALALLPAARGPELIRNRELSST